jgi:predicted DNA-binding protein YlxM (UPF0122 family)
MTLPTPNQSKKNAKTAILTDKQKKFINENFEKFTHQEIADKLRVPRGVVQRHCYYNRLTKTAAPKYKPPLAINPSNRVQRAFERVVGQLPKK